MLKKILLFVFMVSAMNVLSAQQKITGTVKDDKGNPVSFAFIRDMGTTSATFSDTLGNFEIAVKPNSSVEFLAKGYAGIVANVTIATNVVLKRTGDAATASTSQTAAQNNNNLANQNFTLNSALFVKSKDETQGSIYLLDKGVHGFIVDHQDSVLQNPDYHYNYDKLDGCMVFIGSDQLTRQVNSDLVKTFTLFTDDGKALKFEKVPSVDAYHFVQVLASGSKYEIYKLTKTKFMKADYQTNGISSSGNNFDSYKDDLVYYVYNVQTKSVQKTTLKKKALKVAFGSDGDNVDKYMSDHKDDIDDNYLTDLGGYLNQ